MIKIRRTGNFIKTEGYLKRLQRLRIYDILDTAGKEGVVSLRSNTPIDTGKTANAWSYKITKTKYGYNLFWENSNIQNGVPIAMILQYGHATLSGTFIPGYDYINPSIEPIFKSIKTRIESEVKFK